MAAQSKILTIDKLWHLILWFIGVSFVTLCFGPILGVVVGITVGVGKELWDKNHGGIFDWWDLVADLLGTALGIWVVIKFG